MWPFVLVHNLVFLLYSKGCVKFRALENLQAQAKEHLEELQMGCTLSESWPCLGIVHETEMQGREELRSGDLGFFFFGCRLFISSKRLDILDFHLAGAVQRLETESHGQPELRKRSLFVKPYFSM